MWRCVGRSGGLPVWAVDHLLILGCRSRHRCGGQCRGVAVSGCCHCHDHATPPAGRRRVVPPTAPGWVTYARGVDGAIVVETFMDSLEPAAFLSYVRADDQHEGGLISQFRKRLSAEVRMQIGQDFPIFQDRSDIAWGQNWQARIDETLDTVTLLILVMTPSFFTSAACRQEVTQFLKRERQLDRGDLILPVYYVSAPRLDDAVLREVDPLATALFARQYADWRELRFEPFTAPVVRKALAHLASQMGETFWRAHTVAGPREPGGVAIPTADTTEVPRGGTERASAVKQEPPTHVVDPLHRGDFPTITAAIQAACPGDRIVVRPGLYQENLVLDKPLEIIGQGAVEEIIVQAQDASVLLFKTNMGRVTNLMFRQLGGKKVWYGVDIEQGRLELEGCHITSRSGACVGIHNGADPRLRRNQIYDGKQNGILVHNDGLGILEDNDITGNTLAGVEIKTGGNPTLRRNLIHDGKQAGVFVLDNGLGTLEDNDITGNTKAGVVIMREGNPILRRNRINYNRHEAVRIHDGGSGMIEDNDLSENARGAWDVAEGIRDKVRCVRNKEG